MLRGLGVEQRPSTLRAQRNHHARNSRGESSVGNPSMSRRADEGSREGMQTPCSRVVVGERRTVDLIHCA
jgi:hypothetical protein